jgi:hypothetical protein
MVDDLRRCGSSRVRPLFYLGFREAQETPDLTIWNRVTLNELSGVAFGDVKPLAQFGEGKHSRASSV